MSTQYREVKRKAAVGERIKIVAAGLSFGHYDNGDILTVIKVDSDGDAYFPVEKRDANPDGTLFAGVDEYVVLEPLTNAAAPQPDADSFRQFILANADAIRAILPELESGITAPAISVDSAGNVKATGVSVSKPKLNRADVIAKATADVAELLRIGNVRNASLPQGPFADRFYKVEFHVNREKRVVTALIKPRRSACNDVLAKFAAKCSPADVFHAEIGKAIALRKALGLTVPSEYTDAPQPEEPRVGAKVRGKLSGEQATVESIAAGKCNPYKGRYDSGLELYVPARHIVIIDDTDVDYSGVIKGFGLNAEVAA